VETDLQKQVENIAELIHFIRGEKIILDSDLARLYEVSTKVLKQAVRRNLERFPTDFMFELTENEIIASRSQIVTLKRGQNIKYRPFAFTEQGVAMLSGILNSKEAIAVNIAIMRAFVQLIFETIRQLIEKKREPIEPVGFRMPGKE